MVVMDAELVLRVIRCVRTQCHSWSEDEEGRTAAAAELQQGMLGCFDVVCVSQSDGFKVGGGQQATWHEATNGRPAFF